jgi:protoheme IX farnesyltransferase
VYLFLATLPCDILSGFLVFSDRVAYPVYLSAPRHFGLWLLWGIVFLWQFPHFMAIAWMYREDYARAGYMVLPLGEKRDRFVTWQTSLASLALLPVALIPMSLGVSGPAYYAGRFALGAIFLYYGIRFALRKSNAAARDLLVASILYLPLLFALLILSVK